MKSILTQIKPDSAPPIITLYGTEPYFREEALAAVKKKTSTWECTVYDGAVDKEDEVIGALQEYSLGGARKLVILRNPEKMKGKKLTSYIENPVDDNLLLLYSESGDARKQPLKAAVEHHPKFKSEPLKPFGNDFVKWLKNVVHADGYTISDDVARIVVNNVGTNLFLLKREIEKVYLCIDGTLITRADLPGVINRTVVNQIFELNEALDRKDAKKVLKLLANIYRYDVDPAMWILTAFMNHFQKKLAVLSLRAEGFDSNSIAEQLEMHPFRYKKAIEPYLKNFTVGEVLKYMKKLCGLDVAFRTSITDKRTALESFLIEVCT